MENNRKIILYVNDSGKLGGAGKILMNLLNGLDRRKYLPKVICGSDGPLVKILYKMNIEVSIVPFFRPLPMGDRKGFWLPKIKSLFFNCYKFYLSVRRTRKYLKRNYCDLVHTNGLISNLVTSLAIIGYNKPLIWHEHGIQPPGFRRIVYCTFANLFPKKIIAVSNSTRNTYIPYIINKRKIVTIYNGLNINNIEEKEKTGTINIRRELNLKKSSKLIVMASLFMPWKGHEIFIQACKLLEKKIPNSYFLILGDALSSIMYSYKERLYKLVKDMRLNERVIFLGFRNDIFSIFKQANVIVSPSIQPDPFPTVILESMHAGKPVVATCIGGQIEMVENKVTGLLVSPGNPKELAKAIEWLLTNQKRAQEMGQLGKKRVKEKFSFNNFINEIQKIYEKVI